ncbi:zinc knuckle CX2CX4HX4C containing protein [Tanacetum coccineum]
MVKGTGAEVFKDISGADVQSNTTEGYTQRSLLKDMTISMKRGNVKSTGQSSLPRRAFWNVVESFIVESEHEPHVDDIPTGLTCRNSCHSIGDGFSNQDAVNNSTSPNSFRSESYNLAGSSNATIHDGLFTLSFGSCLNEFNVGGTQRPTKDIVALLFSMSLTPLKDIDILTKNIKAGNYDDVIKGPNRDERDAVMAVIMALWESFMADRNDCNIPGMESDKASLNVENGSHDRFDKRSSLFDGEPIIKISKTSIVDNDPRSDSPIVFSKDGLSLIATKIGKPIMLDSYTSSMCIDSWVRSNFVGCLIEVRADDVLKESVTIGIPLLDGSGYSKETIHVEYEWKSPRCDQCIIFGHVHEQCPKNITSTPIVDESHDGCQAMVNKRNNGKTGSNSNSTNFNGVKIGVQSVKLNVKYVPKATVSVPKTRASNVVNTSKLGSSNAPTSKNKPPKASVLPTSSSGSLNGKNGGTKSNIPVSNPYVVLDEYVNLLCSAKIRAST